MCSSPELGQKHIYVVMDVSPLWEITSMSRLTFETMDEKIARGSVVFVFALQ